MPDLLKRAFEAESFRRLGHNIVDVLADHLGSVGQGRVFNAADPNREYEHWRHQMEHPSGDSLEFLNDFVRRATHLHHPKYMGHQVCSPAPVAALASFVAGLLNNGMAVYEMGPAATVLERWIIEQTAQRLGFAKGGGFLTSGGTLGMTTALLVARAKKLGVESMDFGTDPKWSVIGSSEAHYCSARACHVMGWGRAGFVTVPVDDRFKIRVDLLDEAFERSMAAGRTPIAVVGSACTTSTGSYDDLNAIADFCQRRALWFHVDGAHGAAVAFCPELRAKIAGIERADSVVLDFHKLLMTPALATAVIFREEASSWAAFEQKAAYLWDGNQQEEWFNVGRRTFECTKMAMSLRIAAIWRTHGVEIFEEYLRLVHSNAELFEKLLRKDARFEIAVSPESNIVCFRLRARYLSDQEEDALQSKIRRRMILNGEWYIVQTTLGGRVWLRTALMNPFTTEVDLRGLLERVAAEGASEAVSED